MEGKAKFIFPILAMRRHFQQYRATGRFRRALAIGLFHRLADRLDNLLDRVSLCTAGDDGDRRPDRARMMRCR
jgi:hypothetical protein